MSDRETGFICIQTAAMIFYRWWQYKSAECGKYRILPYLKSNGVKES